MIPAHDKGVHGRHFQGHDRIESSSSMALSLNQMRSSAQRTHSLTHPLSSRACLRARCLPMPHCISARSGRAVCCVQVPRVSRYGGRKSVLVNRSVALCEKPSSARSNLALPCVASLLVCECVLFVSFLSFLPRSSWTLLFVLLVCAPFQDWLSRSASE